MTLAGGMDDTGNEAKSNGIKRQDLMYLGIGKRGGGREGGEREGDGGEKTEENNLISISNTG